MKPKSFETYQCESCNWHGKYPIKLVEANRVDAVLIRIGKEYLCCPVCYGIDLILQHGQCVEQLTKKMEPSLKIQLK